MDKDRENVSRRAKVQKIIFIYNTAKLQKIESLAEFERFIHLYVGQKLPSSCKVEVLALTDLFQQAHISPEEKGSFKDNLDEKLLEFVLALQKLSGGDTPENTEALDRHILYHLGISREDVFSGKVLVVGLGEDSGIVQEGVNGKLLQMIQNTPEVFGEDAPVVQGILNDAQIMKTLAVTKQFPGVETSPTMQALGATVYARMIKAYGDKFGFNTAPKTEADLQNAMKIHQNSFLSWFLWYPGMKIDPEDLSTLKARQASSTSLGYFTAADLDKGGEFDIENIIIPEGIDCKEGEVMPTEKSLGYPYNGPLSRYECYAKMLDSLMDREFFFESLGNKVSYTRTRRIPIEVINQWANGHKQEDYNIALIGAPNYGANSSIVGENAFKYQLRDGFKLHTLTPEQLYQKDRSAFLNFEAISRNIIKPNDAWVFGAFDQKTITREQKIMLYGAVFEAIIAKSISPEHKNKALILLNENGCYNELYNDVLVKMYNMGALGDAPSRLVRLINNPTHGNISEELRRHSGSYFKVDIYGKSNPRDEIETYPSLGLGENEYAVVGLCSASLRGEYYAREKNFAHSLANAGFIGCWGLGDKIGSMGGFYHGYMEHARDKGLNRPRLEGSSTHDIVTAETYSGKGVAGVDGLIFEGLAPRTFHLLQAQGHSATSGGAGTAYEILAQFIDEAQKSKPKVYRTMRADDPINDLVKAVTGVSPEKPENDMNIHFVIGSGREKMLQTVDIFRKDRAAKYPDRWGVGNELLIS